MELTKERWFRASVGVILFLVIVWLLAQVQFIFTPIVLFIQTLFLPFLISGILFYLCRPLIQVLESWRVPRTAAILLIFLLIISLLTFIVLKIGPIVQQQFVNLYDNIPGMIKAIQGGLALLEEKMDTVPPYVQETVNYIGGQLESIFKQTGAFVGNFLSGLFELMFAIIVVPFILFYLLKDSEKFVPQVVRLFPSSKEKEIRDVLSDMDNALGSYIQGQLFVSMCVGVLLFIGYMIIGLDYALLLALIGMVLNVIPFLGPFLAGVPAVIVAFFQDPMMVVWALIAMTVAQQTESNLISPQVIGHKLNIHPLMIILLILVGGKIAGILGMILIVPSYAVLKVIAKHSSRLLAIRRAEKANGEV